MVLAVHCSSGLSGDRKFRHSGYIVVSHDTCRRGQSGIRIVFSGTPVGGINCLVTNWRGDSINFLARYSISRFGSVYRHPKLVKITFSKI